MNAITNSGETALSFAHWVRDVLTLMRTGPSGRIALFESSVPEPSDLLAELISDTFRDGMPDTYKSVFMRSHPDLVSRLSSRYEVPEESVLCTTGATSTLSLLYAALLQAGDHILVEAPGFDIFTNLAKPFGVDVDFCQRQAPGFTLSVDEVLAALKPETRLVVLTNLHNPSGACTSEAVLAELASALERQGVILVLDEVYRDYKEDLGAGLDPDLHPNLIRIGSFTKMFGLSSIRCGWMFTGPRLMQGLRDFSEKTDFSVSRVSHGIAAEVLAKAEVFDGWRTRHMAQARPVAERHFAAMQADGLISMRVPLNGCTCFPQVVGVKDTLALSRWLLETCGLVVVPGECFAAPGHLRIGYGLAPDRLEEGLGRLADGLRAYRKDKLTSQPL